MVNRMTSGADEKSTRLMSPNGDYGMSARMRPSGVEVVCIGETLLDMLPSRAGRRLRDAGAFSPTLGGSPANTSVWLARLGVSAGLITRIGDDEFGAICLRELQQAGVNTSGVALDSELKTGLCFLQIDEEGERSFFSYRTRTAETHFGSGDLDEIMLSQAKAVHLCPTPMKLPAGREAILRAAMIAREHGVTVSADCNLRPKHWNSIEEAAEAGWALARASDVLKLNEEEADVVAGPMEPLDAARRLLEAGPKLVVITLGSEGVIGPRKMSTDTFLPRGCARDATGCGDAWPQTACTPKKSSSTIRLP